ncbi:MAG: cobaltochelatase subunit CobN, partial [Porphyromonas sp.]|nr:cobaltochelatase subunit CobN [Porphyromonas sp.]
EIMKSGASSAGALVEIFTNTFGWNVTKPNVIDKELWDELYNMYIVDTQNLGTREFFRNSNPAALQEISAIMLETHRKGMWAASEEQVKTLVEVHKEMVKEFGSSGFGFSAGNKKLQDFVAQKLPEQEAAEYKKNLNAMLKSTSDNKVDAKDGIRLQKESSEVMESENDSSMKTGLIIASIVVVLFIILIFVLRKKRTKVS